MRVAYDVAPLMNQMTGIGHYTSTVLHHLRQEPDVELTFYALTRNPGDRLSVDIRSHLRHLRLPARAAVTAWEVLGWPPGERLVGDVDVVHGPNFWFPPLKGRKGIVTIHDLTFLLYPEYCTPQVRRYRWIVPRVLERSAYVITPSQTVKNEIVEEFGFDEDRIVVTYEGVRGTFVEARSDLSVIKRLGIEGDFLLFAGTQEPRKNLDRLLQAFSRAEGDIKLVIAGPRGWGSVDLPALAHKLHMDKRVVFSGYLTDPEVAALMQNARAFIFPSLYEGFGLPPLEAMAAGIPVVAARAGALPEVLGDAPFYCDPTDVDSIASAINSALSEEESRKLAIEKGKAVSAKYDWVETARLTAEVYRRTAGS